ncbi:TetR/AcrR family transcriptional regulator [Agreia sp. PsM10]|uniref:TetR/AcrR family transcriptional regulator n=1 Tax=Agreia sp. PsM10 TaxID=3030533 RepID=UPI00263BA682|nr:TetR/AcrR family transcriptional regulator [Agreia sp. PsM10]MDN4640063.1 TetR/AcrR family transcriptional regulator [Agreia sp. PsM10]
MSVLAVCRTAGVARSTFYSHFATLEDLAVATVADAFTAASPADVRRRTAHETSSADITRESVTQMIVTLEDLRTVVLMTTRMASRAAVVERLIAAMTEAVRSAIEVEDSDLEEPALALTADFVAAGTVYATLRWLEQDERDRQAIIDHLMNLLPAVLVGGAR